jgi:uncharacterized membrane protein YkoI
MLRARVSPRVLGSASAVVAAAGIGIGAYVLGSASEAATTPLPLAAQETTVTPLPTDGKDAPATSPASDPATDPATDPAEPTTPAAALTLEEAQAVAAKAAPAPGRVIEWDEDNEPTGLRYDVTLLHADGSTTDVEVDTVTGRVTSIDHDNDGD